MTTYDPLIPRLEERSEKRLIVPELGECWLYVRGAIDHKYGRITYHGKLERVHRAAWMELIGPISNGFLILHKCDVPNCWRPEHLYEGTPLQNMQDKVDRGRHAPGIKGKITEDQAYEIRQLYKPGLGWKLAKIYGVSHQTISDIMRGKTWKIIT